MVDLEQEQDGRWIGEIPTLPGTLTYGESRADALARIQALALRVLADQIEHGEAEAELLNVTFETAA